MEGSAKARALQTLGWKQMESEKGLASWKTSSGLVWENDGSGSWRTQSGCSPSTPCAVPPQSCVTPENPFAGIWSTQGQEKLVWSHGRTDQNGIAPRNWSRLHQMIQPHWEKGQILLWQDHECTSRYKSAHDSNLEAGRSFLLFWQARLSYPNFLPSRLKHIPFILDVRNQILPISLAFLCVYRPMFPRSCSRNSCVPKNVNIL